MFQGVQQQGQSLGRVNLFQQVVGNRGDSRLIAEVKVAAPDSARWHDASGFNPFLVETDLVENVIEALCERAEQVELRA